MRNPIATEGTALTLVQVQTTLENWYTVQLHRRRRLKGRFQRNGEGMKEEQQTLEHKIGRTEGGT
jgi:hypothetical protein